MTAEQTWTVGRLLEWTTDYLRKHDSSSARLDAEVLLAHALGCQRIQLYTSFDREPDPGVRDRFRGLVKERAEGKPVAYLVGRREFYSLPFHVTPDVLIPRPETEFVVLAMRDLAKSSKPAGEHWQIADVGTGSGILAICAAKYLEGSQVTAIDVSGKALEVAKRNAAEHRVAERVTFVEGDLLGSLPAERRFDFIVSNPPYVTSAEYEALSPEVKNFEPRQALEAGPRGTEIVERLVPQAAERLASGGWLLIEISPMLESAVRALFPASTWELGPTLKDLAQHARVIQARRL